MNSVARLGRAFAKQQSPSQVGQLLSRVSSHILQAPTTSYRSARVPWNLQASLQQLHTTSIDMTKALVLGCYQAPGSDSSAVQLTPTAAQLDKTLQGKLTELVKQFGPNKKCKTKIFYNVAPDYPVLGMVGLGSADAKLNEAEDIDERRESVRCGAACGLKAVRDEQGVDEVLLEPFGDAEACAEGAYLSQFYFDQLKSDKYKRKVVKLGLYQPTADASVEVAFKKGQCLAEAQNFCRRLAETPANMMTPTIFCQTVADMLKPFPKVKVVVRDQAWAESKKMGSFLSVAKGSAEPPKFLELHYNNKPNVKPFVMVGKGICFDSGGISLKPSANMDKMRYDMGGAANVVSTMYALAMLNPEVNVIGLTPLCENLPSGTANKPGDVVYAMNGKSIQVDNTDAEGRLVLADGLCYAHEFEPQAVLDIATLTGAMAVALGSAVSGVFTNQTQLYQLIQKAGEHTGDRVWRMPLYSHYKSQVTDSQLADLLNIAKGNSRDGGSCTAAAFLSEFVTCPKWLHLDIAGTMESKDDTVYYGRGMSGRPMRTLYYFLNNYFKSA